MPATQLANRQVQLRMAESGFDFLSKNYQALINLVFPDGIALDIPPTYGKVNVPVIGDVEYWLCQENDCHITGQVNSLGFDLKDPATFTAAINLDLAGHLRLDKIKKIIEITGCNIDLNVKKEDASATILFKITTLDETGYLTFDIDAITLGDIKSSDI
ncbi:MAG: hypothetical protein WC889_13065, partial [Myxococcota bacterium]